MKLYVALSPRELERLLRMPCTKEVVTMVYSDEGIFEIGRKIHKWCITDGEVTKGVVAGREVVWDASTVELKEYWQIPFPHDYVSLERRVYAVDPMTQFVVDVSKSTTTYFRGKCQGVEEWLLGVKVVE